MNRQSQGADWPLLIATELRPLLPLSVLRVERRPARWQLVLGRLGPVSAVAVQAPNQVLRLESPGVRRPWPGLAGRRGGLPSAWRFARQADGRLVLPGQRLDLPTWLAALAGQLREFAVAGRLEPIRIAPLVVLLGQPLTPDDLVIDPTNPLLSWDFLFNALRPQLPPEAAKLTDEILRAAARLLPTAVGPTDQHLVRSLVTRYLPDTMVAYLATTRGARVLAGRTPEAALCDQLRLLLTQLDRVQSHSDPVWDLELNERFLRDKFQAPGHGGPATGGE